MESGLLWRSLMVFPSSMELWDTQLGALLVRLLLRALLYQPADLCWNTCASKSSVYFESIDIFIIIYHYLYHLFGCSMHYKLRSWRGGKAVRYSLTLGFSSWRLSLPRYLLGVAGGSQLGRVRCSWLWETVHLDVEWWIVISYFVVSEQPVAS